MKRVGGSTMTVPAEKKRATAADLPRGGFVPGQRTRNSGYVAARTVGSYMPRLTRKAFEKYGFSTATLLTDWRTIVGADVAGYTLPERLKWPRGVDSGGDVESGAEGRPGATLVLRVDPARALDIQYRGAQILERINGYFGYRAVAAMRVVQGQVTSAAAIEVPAVAAWRSPEPARAVPPPAALAAIADEGLREALARLHAGVTGRVRAL